jgi:hypothetical protein
MLEKLELQGQCHALDAEIAARDGRSIKRSA